MMGSVRGMAGSLRSLAWCAALAPCLLAAGCARPPAGTPAGSPSLQGGVSSSPYAEARAAFRTRLDELEPAPQDYWATTPPASAREIPYRSGGLTLKAWVSEPRGPGERRPAVLFLHGGFSFDTFDWEMTKPYQDAGYVVMVPLLRGENGQPGNFSLYYDEVDDALAAADALAALPYVRADLIYVAGHSAGATLTLLAAMASCRFRAAASFSGNPGPLAFPSSCTKWVPFNASDEEELRMRSSMDFATSFQCPVRLYFGTRERVRGAANIQLAELAKGAGLDVQATPMEGGHLSYVEEAMRLSIEFFNQNE